MSEATRVTRDLKVKRDVLAELLVQDPRVHLAQKVCLEMQDRLVPRDLKEKLEMKVKLEKKGREDMLERMEGTDDVEREVRGVTKVQVVSQAEQAPRDQLGRQVWVFLEPLETKAAGVHLVLQDPVVCEADLERMVL